MNFLRTLAAAGLSLFVASGSAPAMAAPFEKPTQMFVFSDSLSDQGNLYALTASLLGTPLPSSPPYYNGRITNGPNYIDYLSQMLGLSLTNVTDPNAPLGYLGDGVNFAFGTAQTGSNGGNPLAAPGLLDQVDSFAFLSSIMGAPVDPSALFIVWGGPNDYFNGQTDPSVPAQNLSQAVLDLAAVGARNFVVLNMGDIGLLPGTRNTPQSADLTLAAQAQNFLMTQLLTADAANAQLNLSIVDFYSLGTSIIGDPAAYGFNNVTDACNPLPPELTPVMPPLDCSGFLFFDIYHPTTEAHAALATLIYNQVLPEPGTLALFGTALGLAAFARRRRAA